MPLDSGAIGPWDERAMEIASRRARERMLARAQDRQIDLEQAINRALDLLGEPKHLCGNCDLTDREFTERMKINKAIEMLREVVPR